MFCVALEQRAIEKKGWDCYNKTGCRGCLTSNNDLIAIVSMFRYVAHNFQLRKISSRLLEWNVLICQRRNVSQGHLPSVRVFRLDDYSLKFLERAVLGDSNCL